MQSAILIGLLQPFDRVVQQTQFFCASPSCTFDQFESLSVCHKCNNLTNELQRERNLGKLDWTHDSRSSHGQINGTDFRLPNGQLIDNFNGWQYSNASETAPATGMLMTSFGTGISEGTVTMQCVSYGYRPIFAHFLSLSVLPCQLLWHTIWNRRHEIEDGLWKQAERQDSPYLLSFLPP